MEEKKDEAILNKYNNPFRSILLVVQVVSVVALLGYWCFPAIVNSLQILTVWFILIMRNILVVFVLVNALIVSIYVSFSKTTEKNKPDLYDQYYAAVPTVVRTTCTPKYNYYRVTEVEDDEYNHSDYKEIVRAFQSVKESSCNDDHQEVVDMKSKSYRRTKSEKKSEKTRTKVEYRRTESERVTKTTSWKSQNIDGLSSEEFRMTVETFITEKKKTLLRENGVVEQCQNGVVEWQGSRDNESGRHRSRSRSHRLVGGSGSNSSAPYLAISN